MKSKEIALEKTKSGVGKIMKKYRYLVYAFFFTMPKRITGYNSYEEAIDYVSGCRMSETPYLFIDTKETKVISVEYFDMPKEELIRQFESEEHL